MYNPPPQKPELPIWVWALIGSGGTLLLFLAGYGIWSLTNSTSIGMRGTDTEKESKEIFRIVTMTTPTCRDYNSLELGTYWATPSGTFVANNNLSADLVFKEKLMELEAAMIPCRVKAVSDGFRTLLCDAEGYC